MDATNLSIADQRIVELIQQNCKDYPDVCQLAQSEKGMLYIVKLFKKEIEISKTPSEDVLSYLQAIQQTLIDN